MSDQISTAQILSRAKEANLSQNARMNMRIWLDEYGTERAFQVELPNIGSFKLIESMFLKLPVGEFTFYDYGSSREINRFYSGRTLWIGFEYTQSDESTKNNVSKGRFRIVGSKTKKAGDGRTEYVVTFVSDALGMFNCIPKYPKTSPGSTSKSSDVLGSVAGDIGLGKLSSNVEPSDDQLWFNPNMNADDFITFVVNHSYVSENDFGMFWINKNCEARFYGMRKNFENGVPYFFDTDVNRKLKEKVKHVIFNDLFQKDVQKMTVDELKDKYSNKCYILIEEMQKNNSGWTADVAGNTAKVEVFDTMLKSILYDSDDVEFDGFYHLTHTLAYKQFCSGELAADSRDSEVTRSRQYNGYTNLNLHPGWELCPTLNSILRSEFFANRHTIKLNAGKQLPCFGDQDLRIGDVLDVDYTSMSSESMVDSGKCVIHTIEWMFRKGSDLEIKLRVATDAAHPADETKMSKAVNEAK